MGRPKTKSDEEVLAVARNLFRSEGRSVSTRRIAEASGLSQAVLFQRFGSKDDLFFAASVPPRLAIEDVIAALDVESSLQEQLVTVGSALIAYLAEILPHAFQLIQVVQPTGKAHDMAGANAVLNAMANLLVSLQSSGRVRPDIDCHAAAETFLAMTHGLALHRVVFAAKPKQLAALLDRTTAALCQGLEPVGRGRDQRNRRR